MSSAIKNIGLMTSGGDAPGMNACIRAVVRTAIHHNIYVFGIIGGYDGLIDGEFKKLDASSVSNIIKFGGTILKTGRCERFFQSSFRKQAYEQLKAKDIRSLICIGGDGSYAGLESLSNEYPDIQVIGLPGTIDNDLFGTDYTIGFDTAVNTAVRAVDYIRDTAESHNRLFFVEVMGKDAGFLALRVGLAAGAEQILIPEIKTHLELLSEKIQTGWNRKKSSFIVIIAEGDDEGGALEIANKLRSKFTNLEIKTTILGHIQRGGDPSAFDRLLASRLGANAIEYLMEGKTKVALGFESNDVNDTPLEKAIKHHTQPNPKLLQLVDILSS